MNNPMSINLDEYKNLFRDDASFDRFVAMLKGASGSSTLPIFSGRQLLGGIASPLAMKEYLSERFLKRIAEKPELLEEIADRLENDEVVE
jgi:hypothetical protein